MMFVVSNCKIHDHREWPEQAQPFPSSHEVFKAKNIQGTASRKYSEMVGVACMCIYWRAVVLIVRKSTSAALTPQKQCTAEIDAMAWQLRQLRVEPRAMVRPRSCLRIP